MDDLTLTPFERQLSGRLERYAERVVVPFDAAAVTRAVAAARPQTRAFWVLPRARLMLQIAMVVVLLLAAVAAALLIGASRGPKGLIAFAATGGITVVNPDGSGTRILAADAGEVSFPTWSPDGKRIAFWSKPSNLEPASLAIVDRATGSRVVIATLNPQSIPVPISWAPDGSHLAYPAFSELSSPEVMIIGADGTGLHSVAPELQASDPAWSPDGRQIAFRAFDPTDLEIVRLYVAEVDGTAVRPLLTVNEFPSSDEARIGVQLDWSPDGTRIAFGSARTHDVSENGIAATWKGIAVMDVATGVVRDVTSGDYEQLPIWSPDGRWIAFGHDPDGGDLHMVGLVRPDGSDLRIFADVPVAENSQSWSPDGTHLLAMTPDGKQILVIPIDGATPSAFPANVGDAGAPPTPCSGCAAPIAPSWQPLP